MPSKKYLKIIVKGGPSKANEMAGHFGVDDFTVDNSSPDFNETYCRCPVSDYNISCVQKWFVSDVNLSAPYPEGSCLWWGELSAG